MFFLLFSLHSDVLFGSYYLSYLIPGLIWYHEHLGMMLDHVLLSFLRFDLLHLDSVLGDEVLGSWSHLDFLILECSIHTLLGSCFREVFCAVLHILDGCVLGFSTTWECLIFLLLEHWWFIFTFCGKSRWLATAEVQRPVMETRRYVQKFCCRSDRCVLGLPEKNKKTQTLHTTSDMSRKIPVFCFTPFFFLRILCFFFALDSIEVGYSEDTFVGRSIGWGFDDIQDLSRKILI